MTIVQLGYVVAVDNLRHFAEAADHCHVTQPTLSMQLYKLEQEIGVKLFDRSKQPVVPTEGGKEFIAQARKILAEVDVLQNIVEQCASMARFPPISSPIASPRRLNG